MYKLDRTGNAVFSLFFHFIVVVKYRKKVFTNDEIISYVKECFDRIAFCFDVTIVEQQCGSDHIHVLFKCKPTLDIPRFINRLKGASSKSLRYKYKKFLKNRLWGTHFWSPSYFLATSGNVTVDVLRKYIENQ